jgi:hypothetical protein
MHVICPNKSDLAGGDDPPIARSDKSAEVTGLAAIAIAIPLRKNSALLKGVSAHEIDGAGSALLRTYLAKLSHGHVSPADRSVLNPEPDFVAAPEPYQVTKYEPNLVVRSEPNLVANFCASTGLLAFLNGGGRWTVDLARLPSGGRWAVAGQPR